MRISITLILVILCFNLNLSGQMRTIVGRVISEDFEPLPNVNIQNNNNVSLGETNLDGRFIINIPTETDKLLLSWIGMERTDVKLVNDCNTIEIIMLYDGTYDFMSSKKIDRLRKKRFDELPHLHFSAVKKGLFSRNTICYKREFKPEKSSVDSIAREIKSQLKQVKETYKKLTIGDTIRIPYSGSWGFDGTDRTTLSFYSYVVDGENFDCIVKGVIIEKDIHKRGYNLVYRVIDCQDCHFDKPVLNNRVLKVGDLIDYNVKYFKILKNK